MTLFPPKSPALASLLFLTCAWESWGSASAQQSPPATNASPPLVVLATPVAARYDAAMALYNSGNYAQAIPALSAFVTDFPQSNRREEILYRLGESYRALGRPQDALAAYTYQVQASPAGPFLVNAELRRGQIHFEAGQFAEAIPSLEVVVSKGQGDLQQAGQYLLARALLAAPSVSPENEKRARDFLTALLAAQGQFAASSALVLAALEDQEGHYAAALAQWQTADKLSIDPTVKATAAARGGWSALQNNQDTVAEQLFTEARKLDAAPGAPADWRKIANTGLLRLLYRQQRDAEWLAVYQRESPLFLENAQEEIAFDLAQVNFHLKKWPEALAALEAYGKAYPQEANTAQLAYEHFLAHSYIDRAAILPEGDAYLKTWPGSPFVGDVELLQAQELSGEKNFAAALPLWQTLADLSTKPEGKNLPRQAILLEIARSLDTLQKWPEAATAYQAFLDEFSGGSKANEVDPAQILKARTRLALCLQNSDQLLAAESAWKEVQASAPAGSPEQQLALESLGMIYIKGGPPRQSDAVAAFRQILEQFSKSPLRALAAFTVGQADFAAQNYAEAETDLLLARQLDPKSWQQPATQRLVLLAYAQKDAEKTAGYFHEYEALPPPSDPQTQIAARLPAAVPYWLGDQARAAGKLPEAEAYFLRVTRDPAPGDLLAAAWLQLGEVQSLEQKWPEAVTSYQNFRRLKPENKDATSILLALSRAELNSGDAAGAKSLAEQALLQEPEGAFSAQARRLLGDIAFAQNNFPEAARQFATLAVLFDDPKITPQAMGQAALAYEKAGDAKSAAEWRQKLKDKYPNFTP